MSSDSAERTQAEAEARIRALCEGGDTRAAASMALRTYGPEVLGLLITTAGNPTEADEVFSLVCEDVWKGLGSFQWRSSLRTWIYVLARNAYLRYRVRSARHVVQGSQPIDTEVLNLAAEVRNSTASYVRTERQERVRRIRSALSPDDQMLLTLRVDRQMEWTDIAAVLEPEVEDVKRAASTLRKRFQRLKERLRELAGAPEEP